MNVLDFQNMKKSNKKISMITCYDYFSAQLIDQTNIDAILVGDSVAMVMHGYPSTISATPEMMAIHTKAVAKGAKNKLIISDMPFLSFRNGISQALSCVDLLMKSGAHAIKVEGVKGHEDTIQHIVESGIPVMGHLGLTPQSIHQLGGFKVQGTENDSFDRLVREATELEKLGCFAIVLECVPTRLGSVISSRLNIPTIGIGAGPGTDGQILVLHDLLGLVSDFKPKFVRQYVNGQDLVTKALNHYNHDVKSQEFPNQKECYS